MVLEKTVIFDTHYLVQNSVLTQTQAKEIRTKLVEKYFLTTTSKDEKGAWVTNNPENLLEFLFEIIPHKYKNQINKIDLNQYSFYKGSNPNLTIPAPFNHENLDKIYKLSNEISNKCNEIGQESWMSGNHEQEKIIIQNIVESNLPLVEYAFFDEHLKI